LLIFICSSEVDYEDFESIEQDEIIQSDCCSDENGKTLSLQAYDYVHKCVLYTILHTNGHEY